MTINSGLNRVIPTSQVIDSVGAFATAIGGGLLAEGNLDEGAEATFFEWLASPCSGLIGHANALGLCNQEKTIASNAHHRTKASAIIAAAGASLRGFKNIFSGIYNRDLRQVGKGTIQQAIASAGLYATTCLTPAVVAAFSYAAMSSYCFYEGMKEFSNGQKVDGALYLFGGTCALIASAAAMAE